jgi:1-acyl-sn-glycerol-3-phosphate acyltransferase
VVFTVYVWFLGIVTLTPLWGLLLVLPRGRVAADAVSAWSWLILRLTGCPIDARGMEHVPASGPAVIVVNHASYFDAIALMAALRCRFRFVVNHRAAGWPLVGLAIRKSGHLVVNRGRLADRHACARAMIETLREGVSVVVFPEGTFDRAGRLLPFQPGPFRVAAEAACPVVPIAMHGTRHVLEGGLGRFRRGNIVLTASAAIWPVSTGRQDVAALRDQARSRIVAGLTEQRERVRQPDVSPVS